jgi:hypothetical protein
VSAALAALLPPEALTEAEFAIWLNAFSERTAVPSATEEAFFARRRKLGLGLGDEEPSAR